MRDLALENEVLAFALEMCERVYGYAPGGYARDVQNRLALGAEQYGDNDFMGKDNLVEAAQETPDISSYLLLELQKLRPLVSDDEWQDLRMAAVAGIAAAAHAHAQVTRMRVEREQLFAGRAIVL